MVRYTASGSVDAPFVYQRVDSAELVVTVEVNVASSVQWDEGGLLVMAEGDAGDIRGGRAMREIKQAEESAAHARWAACGGAIRI